MSTWLSSQQYSQCFDLLWLHRFCSLCCKPTSRGSPSSQQRLTALGLKGSEGETGAEVWGAGQRPVMSYVLLTAEQSTPCAQELHARCIRALLMALGAFSPFAATFPAAGCLPSLWVKVVSKPGSRGQAQHGGLGPSCGLALRAASAAVPKAALGFLSRCSHQVGFELLTAPISAPLCSRFGVEGNLPRSIFLLQKVREFVISLLRLPLPAQTPSCHCDKKKTPVAIIISPREEVKEV